MQKQRRTTKTQAADGQQIERHTDITARAALLASEAIHDELRPAWELVVAASTMQEGEAAFFGGSRKKLEAKLAKANMPLSVIDEFERMRLILCYSTLGIPSSAYIFVMLGFPESFPDSFTAKQRCIARDLIDKHASELPEEQHTVAVYTVACSFAIAGGQLRFSPQLLKVLLQYHSGDFTKYMDILESWRRDKVIKSLVDSHGYVMFDYNYLVGDWEES